MGKKKKRGAKRKPFCYYCDRGFDDEKVLIQHQKAKHFKCRVCNKKMTTVTALGVHLNNVHKEKLEEVPNAVPSRRALGVEVYGMEGVPADVFQGDSVPSNKKARLEKVAAEAPASSAAPAAAAAASTPAAAMAPFPPHAGMPPAFPHMPMHGMPHHMMPPRPGFPGGMPPMMGPRPGFPGGMMPGGMPPRMPPGFPPHGFPPQGFPPQGFPPRLPGQWGSGPPRPPPRPLISPGALSAFPPAVPSSMPHPGGMPGPSGLPTDTGAAAAPGGVGGGAGAGAGGGATAAAAGTGGGADAGAVTGGGSGSAAPSAPAAAPSKAGPLQVYTDETQSMEELRASLARYRFDEEKAQRDLDKALHAHLGRALS